MDILTNLKGFDWDEGNITKTWEKHRVTHIECEEVFFNNPLVASLNGIFWSIPPLGFRMWMNPRS